MRTAARATDPAIRRVTVDDVRILVVDDEPAVRPGKEHVTWSGWIAPRQEDHGSGPVHHGRCSLASHH
jgi:hypothetical protein